MNKGQKAKFNMFIACALYFIKYGDLFKDFLNLVKEISGFTGVKSDLETDIGVQEREIKGITTSKNKKIEAAIELTYTAARKARVWAENEGQDELEELFDVHDSDFEGIGDAAILERLKVIKKGLGDNIASLAENRVLPADIAAIEAAISEAKASIGKPEEAVQVRSKSTENIDAKLDKGETYLFKIDDLLISEYKKSHPEEVAEYRKSRVVEAVGRRSTGIRATIKNEEGELLHNVIMGIPALKRTSLSNYDGQVEILKFKPKEYEVEFSLDGFITNKILVKVNRGKVVELAVTLVAKTLEVIVTKSGTPVAEYGVSVVGTSISGATNAKGIVDLRKAPNKGVVEVSSPGGDLVSMPYDFGEGNSLKVNVAF